MASSTAMAPRRPDSEGRATQLAVPAGSATSAVDFAAVEISEIQFPKDWAFGRARRLSGVKHVGREYKGSASDGCQCF